MSNIAFLITNRYQINHYRPIAAALPDPPTFIIETRDQDFGVDPEFVRAHVPGVAVETVAKRDLRSLDGVHRLIVCQTPVLPQVLLDQTLVVAQQYSLAKETYQYGVWRSLVSTNLMYGPYSTDRISGFCHAQATGNPMFDGFTTGQGPAGEPGTRTRRVLYLPTYGSLSSVAVVLPMLAALDCEVVVKLHHMDPVDRLGNLPENCTQVGPESDPLELLRDADLVVSDFSGAAFDAVYAGKPLALAGTVDPLAEDFHRLSTDDIDRSVLGPISVPWDPSRPLDEIIGEATARIDSDRYLEFRDRFFVNHGHAGQACATAILELLEHGEQLDFGQRQVRARNRDLLERMRALNEQNHEVTLANRQLQSPGRRTVGRLARAAYRRSRPALAEHAPALERRLVGATRSVQRVRQRRRLETQFLGGRPDADGGPAPSRAHSPDGLGVTPAERCLAVAERLLQHAGDQGMRIEVVETDDRLLAAVQGSERRALLRLLQVVAADTPGLLVRIGRGAVTVEDRPAAEVKIHELHAAPWIEVGVPLRTRAYDGGVGEMLKIVFVAFDSGRGRLLSVEPRAAKVDWTATFDLPTRPTDGLATTVDGPPRHSVREIDVVYTWVDSSDPAWRQAHRQHSQVHTEPPDSANNAERFLDREELRYSLRSLWLFAPFVRRIFLVTNGQVPSWLDQTAPGLTVVTHDEIFPDREMLPTFNSHAIEACLHRIPDLAEHFIYFNDDFFLARMVERSDFFTVGGLLRVRTAPTQFIYEGKPDPQAIPTDWAAFNATRIVEDEFGLRIDRKLQHTPYSARRSIMEEIEKRYPDEVDRTRRARFRSRSDLALPSMLAPLYAVASGRGVEWPSAPREYVYADTGRIDCAERFDTILLRRPEFFCLNSTKHKEVPLDQQAAAVMSLLDSMYPFPSPFELPPGAGSAPPSNGA